MILLYILDLWGSKSFEYTVYYRRNKLMSVYTCMYLVSKSSFSLYMNYSLPIHCVRSDQISYCNNAVSLEVLRVSPIIDKPHRYPRFR